MTSFLELISTFSRESFVPSKKHIIDIAMKLDQVVTRMLSQKAYEVMIVGGEGRNTIHHVHDSSYTHPAETSFHCSSLLVSCRDRSQVDIIMSYYCYISGLYKSYIPQLNRTLRSSSVPRRVPDFDTGILI